MQDKHNHSKKLIAPIIVSVILIVYYCFFVAICLIITIPFILKLIMGIISLALAGVVIYVLVERIKEIRSGVEDDLSQY